MIIFSCPKQFKGDASRLQRSAVENWIRIGALPHLAGPQQDIDSIPEDLKVEASVVVNSSGVSPLPMFGDILNTADPGDRGIHCYANADIILPDVFRAFRFENGRYYYLDEILPERFLFVGSRWDFQEGIEYDAKEIGDSLKEIGSSIKQYSMNGGIRLSDPDAMDYFVFPPLLFQDLSPLIVGRGGYDNALIAYCLRKRIPVIDVSHSWPVLHQFHGYGHKAGGKREVYLGDEAMFNRRTHDIVHSPPNSLDADYVLENGRLRAVPWRCGVLRRCELTLRYRWGMKWFSYFFRCLQRVIQTQERISKREIARTKEVVFSMAKA